MNLSRQARRALERQAAKTRLKYPNASEGGVTFGMRPEVKPLFADNCTKVGACHIRITGETDFVDALVTAEMAQHYPVLSNAQMLAAVQRIGYLLDADRGDSAENRAEALSLLPGILANNPTYKMRGVQGFTITTIGFLVFKSIDGTYGLVSGPVAEGAATEMKHGGIGAANIQILSANKEQVHPDSTFKLFFMNDDYTANDVGSHTRMQNGKLVTVRPYSRG